MSAEESGSSSLAPALKSASRLYYALAMWIAVSGTSLVLIILSPQFAQYGVALLFPVGAFFLEGSILLCFLLGFYLSKVGELLGIHKLKWGLLLAVPMLATFSSAFALFLLGSFSGSLDALSGTISLLLVVCFFVSIATFFPSFGVFSSGMSEVTRRIRLGELRSHRKLRGISLLLVLLVLIAISSFSLQFLPTSYDLRILVPVLLWGALLFVVVPVTLIMSGSEYGNPDAATPLPEPLPKKDRSAPARLMAEVPKIMMQEMEKIELDKAFETKKFKIMVKGDIYILVPRFYRWITPTPIFIRFLSLTVTPQKKVVVPYGWSMRKMRFEERVAGFPAKKFRGSFTVPINVSKGFGGRSEVAYAKGRGIAYVVDGYGGVRSSPFSSVMPPLPHLDKETILEVIHELSNEQIS